MQYKTWNFINVEFYLPRKLYIVQGYLLIYLNVKVFFKIVVAHGEGKSV